MNEYEVNENKVLEYLTSSTKALKLSTILMEESEINTRINM